MKPELNPFAPGAGAQPPELTGRNAVLERASVILRRIAGGYHDRSCLLIGLRGVGKTVLLNRIQAASHDVGYTAVLLEAPEDRRLADLLAPALRRILVRLDQTEGLKHKLHQAIGALQSFASTFKVTIGDIGVGVEPAARHRR
ncbi:MAG TPA: AAA family ATPase [bacterium]|nr:AAA family ATPase [bacterium]